jgi:RNA polymerase sigma-70 factor (ECF subfamily)
MEQVADWTAFARAGTLYTRSEAQGTDTPHGTVSVAVADQLTPHTVQSLTTAPAHLSLLTDAELVSEVACGNTSALEALYDRHVRGCFGLAMKIVRDPAIAEEVVQDVFLKLWSSPGTFSPERGKFAGWLMTLVHNRSVDKLRGAKAAFNSGALVSLEAESTTGETLSDVLADDGLSPYDTAWHGERGRILSHVLSLLPQTQRQTISMAYFDGLTHKEIAERLQEPLGTIKTRIRTGLHRLRIILSEQGLAGELT